MSSASVEQTTTDGLSVAGLTIRYGGVVANKDVRIDVRPGEVVGLIGPNGAGKTTFVDAVTGFTHPAAGDIRLGGKIINDLAPHRRRHRGLSRTWQSGELFSNLTVSDNIRVAMFPGGLKNLWRDLFSRGDDDAARLAVVLDAVGLSGLGDHIAGDLPLGKQKLVGIARAIVGDCSIVLLDEPAAGLESEETAELGRRIRELADRSIGVLLIDHDMSLVMSVCDRVTVLQFGQVIYSGTPEDAVHDPRVVEAYLGQPTDPVKEETDD